MQVPLEVLQLEKERSVLATVAGKQHQH